MTPYTLYHADCLDVLPSIASGSIDAVIADVPSGRTACAWDSVIPFEPMWSNLKRVVKKHAPIVLLGCTQPFTSALVMSNPHMFKYTWVWEKNRGTGHLNVKIAPLQETEDIVVFGKAAITYFPQMKAGEPYTRPNGVGSKNYGAQVEVITVNEGVRYPGNVLRYPKVERPSHPTQKPLALLEYLVKTYTNEGGTVLDFTMGSGTTGAACGNLGRRFVGIEKDLTYFTQASERIATAYEPLRAMQVAV